MDAGKDIGEVGLGVETVKLGSLDDGHCTGEGFATASDPAKRKFLRPITTGLIARSTALLSMATRLSARKRVKAFQRFRA